MSRALLMVLLVGVVSGCNCGPGVSSARGHLEASPPVVDLGDVPVGGSVSHALTLTNTGRGQVSVTGVLITNDARAAFAAGGAPVALLASDSATMNVVYRAPASPGADAAVLVLALEGADVAELRVPLVARAVERSVDAGSDAGADGGPDSGQPDASVDAGTDAGQDAGADGGVDAEADAGADAGTDAGTDAGADAGTPAGPPCADGGVGCHPMTVRVYNGYACALLVDGRVLCWGLVPDSCCTMPYWRTQPVTEIALPLPAGGLRTLEGGGDTMCVRRDRGPVACWGRQVRPGGLLAQVAGLDRDVERVEGGDSYLCALRSDAGVDCWGGGVIINDGVLPPAVPFPDLTNPTPVAGFGPAEEVTPGFTHICSRNASSLKCWGYNSTNGSCPLGASPSVRLPGIVQPVGPFDAGVATVLAHDRGTCVVDGAGEVWCWGDNLGPGFPGQAFSGCAPTRVTGLDTPVRSLCSGGQHLCALQANGTVRCWGENYGKGLCGYLRDGGYDNGTSVPNLVPALTNAVALSCSSTHNCVRTADARVLCWGMNDTYGVNGALGYVDAGLPYSAVPVQVPLPP